MTIRNLICSCLILAMLAVTSTVAQAQDTTASNLLQLQYDKPADANSGLPEVLDVWTLPTPPGRRNPDRDWEQFALPIGNGHIGAMVFGGVHLERMQLNVKTLWSGGPGHKHYRPQQNLADAWQHLPAIREALYKGDTELADKLSGQWLRGQVGQPGAFGRHNTMGELRVECNHPDYPSYPTTDFKSIDYRRSLDLQQGLATVQYKIGQTTYRREAFASYPDKVMVFYFAADGPDLMSANITVASPHGIKFVADGNQFAYPGVNADNKMEVETRLGVLTDGKVEASDGTVRVEGARYYAIVVTADTDYVPIPPQFKGDHPAERNRQILAAALERGYKGLRQRAIEDYTSLMGRVTLELGDSTPEQRAMLTEQRLEQYKNNKEAFDPDLEETYFQFGRYLLIACSRPGSLPANLQGMWTNSLYPPWSADYHLNINLEMNYWPAGPTNLLECELPLLEYAKLLSGPGVETAKAYFGPETRGWTAHLASNIWAVTAPDTPDRPYFRWHPVGGPWLATHIWEHYAFSGDEEILRKYGNILLDAALFACDALTQLPEELGGHLSMVPSWSPEHGSISVGATYEIAVIREVISDALLALPYLDLDPARKSAIREELEKTRDKLLPYRIGQHGQIQEWADDIDDPKDTHRHVNHLFGLHPGHQIDRYLTPDLYEAAKVTLKHRGDGGTGWSLGWKLNFWARIGDGNHAHALLTTLLGRRTARNMLDLHPPFQIDGNFGAVASMAQMLLQSRIDAEGTEIRLLPALPDVWAKGQVTGLRARGGWEVDLKWEDGKLTEARLRRPSGKAGQTRLRYGEQLVPIQVAAGEEFIFKP